MFSQNEALVTESFTNEDITSTLLNPTENHSDTEFNDEGSVPPGHYLWVQHLALKILKSHKMIYDNTHSGKSYFKKRQMNEAVPMWIVSRLMGVRES